MLAKRRILASGIRRAGGPGRPEPGADPVHGAPPPGIPPLDSIDLQALPEMDFMTLDLREIPASNPFAGKGFDVIVLSQALWGILEALDGILAGLRDSLSPTGSLLISQHFPGEAQAYGRDIVAGPQDLKARLRKAGFKEAHSLETDRDLNHHYGGLWMSS
jgi:SAM-dependent methyltransferase